jgi:hypothetical protein
MKVAEVDRRTLPLRVAPLAGEALDSWLEALAHRHRTPFGTMLQRCSIHHQRLAELMLGHDPRGWAHLTQLTGVSSNTLQAMTLARYSGAVMGLGGGGQRARPMPWQWNTTSRLCPGCLRDSGGRWQIAWRLNWSFACTQHLLLLADCCARCGGAQRRHAHATRRVPRPGFCALTYHPVSSRGRIPCHGDLSATATPTLDSEHPMVRAQRCIDDLLAGRPVNLPVYGDPQPHRREVLRDVSVLARWITAHMSPEHVVTELGEAFADVGDSRGDTETRRCLRGNPTAAEAAVGISLTVTLLQRPDAASAAQAMQQWMPPPLTHTTVRGAASLSAALSAAFAPVCADSRAR